MISAFSYNIHKGFDAGNLNYVLTDMKTALHSISPDLVFLQEVIGEDTKSGREPQFASLAQELWPNQAYGKNLIHDLGHHGNAILSKFPILSSQNFELSGNRFEKRGLLHAQVKAPETVHLFSTHLSLLHRDRKKQVSEVIDFIKKAVPVYEPCILAGDFNDWNRKLDFIFEREGFTEVFKSIHGESAKTFPSLFPILTLDRIFTRGFLVQAAHCHTGQPWNHLSDHVALSAYLEFEVL